MKATQQDGSWLGKKKDDYIDFHLFYFKSEIINMYREDFPAVYFQT